MPIWTLAKKDLRLLLRDRRAVVILFAMPLIFILVLGLSLGQGFGQQPDARLRISIVDQDKGYRRPQDARGAPFPNMTWSQVVQRDLAETAGIRVEIIPTEAEARRLVATSQRAAVLVFGPDFTDRVRRSSFLADGINPFYRNGVKFSELDVTLLQDETQLTAASIIEQVAQVTLLRVVLPWMIGRAFEKLGDPDFIDLLARQQSLPGFLAIGLRTMPAAQKKALGQSLQKAIQGLYPKYNLTAKTWDALTKARDGPSQPGATAEAYVDEGGSGLLKRGAANYQRLVPSQTVMFAFFLVLTVGWLFTAERRQGTLKRLRAAPLSRPQILLGKLVPCFVLSLAQGLFLLAAGKVIFGMSWGSDPLWLLPVVFTTSLAAMGLALLVAALARTETQVAIYGTLLVLVLAGVSGCLMGDRELMPELMQHVSLLTPQAWALVAYKQLLTTSAPNLALVGEACGMLAAFGVCFVGLAWWALHLD